MGGSVTTITRNCVHFQNKNKHQTGFVGAGDDHLQLIEFWRFCASGEGVCGGAKFFGSVLNSQRAVFARL